MHLLFDLPTELLRQIVDCVAPNDLDNFMLYDERLREVAGSNFLLQHENYKRDLQRIEHSWKHLTPYELEELLEMFLAVPSLADYVKKMVINPWKMRWKEEDTVSHWVPPVPSDTHLPYSDSVMRAFEEAINNSNSIPFGEKEHWISTIKTGNQNPIVALLLSRLHYLTYLELVLGDREDLFVLKTLKGIVKDSCSSSLSQLREVKVSGSARLTHRLELATACFALPSIVSVRAYSLVEGPLDSTETTSEMVPRSSCVRDIEINNCRLSHDTLLDLIRAVKSKSLRSFKYTCSGSDAHPAFA